MTAAHTGTGAHVSTGGSLAASTSHGPKSKDQASTLPPLASDHGTNGTRGRIVAGEPSTAAQPTIGLQSAHGGGNSSGQPPILAAGSTPQSNGWLGFCIWAEMHNDAQKSRIASTNRAERGGVEPAIYQAYVESVERSEHICKLALGRTYRRVVPATIIAWQKEQRGIGEHLLARLLGHLGDPYIATPYRWMASPPEDHECGGTCGAQRHLVALEPFTRTVGQLWSYCGHGDPARKRRRLMDADDALAAGSPVCKMLVHLLAEACVKQAPGNRYRDHYDEARAKYADRIHVEACAPCHAKPEQPWKPGHQHAAAQRYVGKQILRDLWLAAREAHTGEAS